MSLRQLKFKPKLQLNPAIKSKAEDNSSRSAPKEAPSSNNSTAAVNNSSSNIAKVFPVQEVSLKKPLPSKTNECNVDISSENIASFKSNERHLETKTIIGTDNKIPCSNQCESVRSSVINDSVSISSNSLTVSQGNSFVLHKENFNSIQPSNKIDDKKRFGPGDERIELLLNCSGSEEDDGDKEVHQISTGVNKTQNSFINYDVLQKISLQNSAQSNSVNSELKVIEHSQKVLVNNKQNSLNESIENLRDSVVKEDKVIRHEGSNEHRFTKISRLQHKPNLGLPKKEDKIVSESTVTKNNYEQKFPKRKKIESKNANISSNKVQKANFKPNLATLGKIRRPEKFTTSSFSKMESIAKEQFFKKFGSQQEPSPLKDSSKLTMMDLIFYNPSSNPMSQGSDKKILSTVTNTCKDEKIEENGLDVKNTEKIENTIEDENKNENDVLPVPQLKISADGKVIVAQESLVIQPSQSLVNFNFENVVDGELRKKKPVKNPNRCGWSHLDTIKFYKALNSLGCDFETMQSIFPDRSRRNLKSKFKKEEKLHGSLINKVLSQHSEFDLTSVVRELEIDNVYQKTIKTYGRGLAENEKRSKGRKKSISSVMAGGRSPGKDVESDDDSLYEEESSSKKKRKIDDTVMSRITNVLDLQESNGSATREANKLSASDNDDDILDSNEEPELVKRRRRKSKENTDSDSDIDFEKEHPLCKKISELKNGENNNLPPRILRNRKKHSSNENLPSNNIIIRLEDLINFNEGIDDKSDSKTEIINENHIVINTNIEFEHVKYTRYISYNSNNLENPIEINETVAHVD